MHISETAYKFFVWSASTVVGLAFLLWLSEIFVGLVVIGSILYTAVHLLTRFGEWYAESYGSDDRATRNPPVAPRSTLITTPDPKLPPPGLAVTLGEQDHHAVREDEARWQPAWQFDDAALHSSSLADQDPDDYYGELAHDERRCAANDEWETEESQLQALEEEMDGAPEGLGVGDDEDGRW
ncbi:MAG: hypothetical protein OXF27_12360 [Acidobacteria bacterium]|nr:hypothetical protein [Acidobacteriota bacterium]